MFELHLSPLAPAAVLLLSAFILFIVLPLVPVTWRAWPGIRLLNAPVLVGITLLTLVFISYTPGDGGQSSAPAVLFGWNFSTADSLALLTVRADPLGLPFLIASLLVLLAVALLTFKWLPHEPPATDRTMAVWLLMTASACTLFVAANGLTIVHSILAFDVMAAVFWVSRGCKGLAVARLFLAAVTVTGLMVLTALVDHPAAPGIVFPGVVLWLRLAVYPMIESVYMLTWGDSDRLTYLSLSMLVGSYLAVRTINQPVPSVILGLTIFTMMVGGILAWTTSSRPAMVGRKNMLNWLLLVEAQLILVVSPAAAPIIITFAVGVILSFVALWVTPALGRPRLDENAWSWPYLPALFATVTVLGLPFTLGWPLRQTVIQLVARPAGGIIFGLLFAAEMLAFSSLPDYWRILWQGHEQNGRRLLVGVVAMVPFLTPVLGLFILSELTKIDVLVSVADFGPLVYVVALGGGAILMSHFRLAITTRVLSVMRRKALPDLVPAVESLSEPAGDDPSILIEQHGNVLATLELILSRITTWLDDSARFVLRIQVVLEGQHYMGWAIFVALLGALILLLN
jgi:hypothetical protein